MATWHGMEQRYITSIQYCSLAFGQKYLMLWAMLLSGLYGQWALAEFVTAWMTFSLWVRLAHHTMRITWTGSCESWHNSGIPIAEEKIDGPGTMVFLGIEIDSNEQGLHLVMEKQAALKELMQS